MSYDAHFRVWRGDAEDGELVDYPVEVNEGEVVLDIIHQRLDRHPCPHGSWLSEWIHKPHVPIEQPESQPHRQ